MIVINVTQKDIDTGLQGEPRRCPMAVSLNKHPQIAEACFALEVSFNMSIPNPETFDMETKKICLRPDKSLLSFMGKIDNPKSKGPAKPGTITLDFYEKIATFKENECNSTSP